MKYDIMVIGGRLFEIDAKNRMLVDAADRGNILLYEHMHNNTVSLDFVYDRDTRRIALSVPISDAEKDGTTISVRIPHGIAYQEYTEGNIKYVFNNSLSAYRGFYLFDENYYDRLAGLLPIMYIGRDSFEVDGEKGTIREEFTKSPLHLTHAVKVEQPDGSFYQGYYDKVLKDLVIVDQNAASLPDNTVWIEFPALRTLDPIGTALKEGKEPYAYIDTKVPRKYEALVVPLADSPLLAVVRENIVKQAEQRIEQQAKGKQRKFRL